MTNLLDYIKRSLDQYNAVIEADLQFWTKYFPLEKLTMVNGSLPTGIPYLREYVATSSEGHEFDRRFLVLTADLKE